MTSRILHCYYVVEDTASVTSMEGGFLIKDGHVRKDHEPHRVWMYMDINTGEATHIKGYHVGEWEKVKPFALAYRDMRNLIPYLVQYRDQIGNEELEGKMPKGSESFYYEEKGIKSVI